MVLAVSDFDLFLYQSVQLRNLNAPLTTDLGTSDRLGSEQPVNRWFRHFEIVSRLLHRQKV
jgi:hypothetical protein